MSPQPRKPKDTEAAEPAEAKKPAAKKPAVKRRGSAETTTAKPAKAAAAASSEAVAEVRAQAKYVRSAPRKARLVVDHIRGKSLGDARAILQHTPRAAAADVLKLLNSCAANAENNHELDPAELFVSRVYVDEGPTLKRYQPRAQGRAFRIRKRSSHLTIVLGPKPVRGASTKRGKA